MVVRGVCRARYGDGFPSGFIICESNSAEDKGENGGKGDVSLRGCWELIELLISIMGLGSIPFSDFWYTIAERKDALLCVFP